jgi:predicted dehydrogenase
VLDVALVGCGHMGRHHARIVAAHPECRLVAVVDAVPDRARSLAAGSGAEPREQVPEGVDVVVVATPTTTHVDVAAPQVRAGRWCLVEKPLAPTAADAARLQGPRTWVGHSERHNPAWHSEAPRRCARIEATRVSPPTGRCRDVDAVLDLLSHDLDLLRWSGRGTARIRVDAASWGTDGQIEAIELHLAWPDGGSASLRASRQARRAERTWRLYDPGHYERVDLGAPPRPGADALTAQWSTFIDAVAGRADVPWPLDDAIAAIAECERVQRAVRSLRRDPEVRATAVRRAASPG